MEDQLLYQGNLFDSILVNRESQGVSHNAVALFALSSIRGVGFATIKSICDELKGNLSSVFRLSPEALKSLFYDARTPNAESLIHEITSRPKELIREGRRTWSKYQAKGVTLLFRGQPNYPETLLDLPSPPSWLFVEGDATLLSSPFLVGFVGTRSPSQDGLAVARRSATHLAQLNAVIVSGLAEGIDAIGHQTALLFGSPTVAVLGHGIDVIFPASTAKLRQDIVLFGGAVVSEYLPGDNYSRDKFVSRNRIQAALSRIVCFIEAKEKSGTAHTLRFSLNLGRPVFGAISGGYRHVPEEELLHVVSANGGYIYDFAIESDVERLTEYIHKAFTQPSSDMKIDTPRMFSNIVREVQRLADEYGATKSDLDWMRRQIGKIRVSSQSSNVETRAKGGGSDATQNDYS